MSNFDLRNFLKENNLTKTSRKSYDTKEVISEAKYERAVVGTIVDKLGDKLDLKQVPTDSNIAIGANSPKPDVIRKEVEKLLGVDVELIAPKQRVEFNSGRVDSISSRFYGLHFNYNGDILNLKLSSASTPGVPTDAAYYEMGLCVEYNKLQGMDSEQAMSKADVDPKKYSTYEEHLTEVCRPLAESLPNMGPFLRQTGGDSYSPSSIWPSSDGTPKTDIYGGGAHRISVKKAGGSQLMSGTSGDASGVFQGALSFYEKYSKQSDKDVEAIIESIKNEFVKIRSTRSVTDIKAITEEAYIEWRMPEIEKELRSSRIKAKKSEIKRHARAELKVIGLADQQGNYEDWFIDGIEPLSERELMRWFDKFWKSRPTEQLQQEIKEVMLAGINHKKLDDEFKKVFDKKEFKQWCVFEAASGVFKFAGIPDIDSKLDPVANEILVFDIGKGVKVDRINEEWAKKYQDKVRPRVGFKSAGNTRATAFRLLSEVNDYNQLSQFEKDTNSIIYKEIKNLHEDIDVLFEQYDSGLKTLNELSLRGMMSKLKKIGNKLISSIKRKIQSFYENIIKRVVNNLYEAGRKGIKKFIEYLGIEVDGSVSIDVSF